jgi:hypothetical protein
MPINTAFMGLFCRMVLEVANLKGNEKSYKKENS